MKGTKAMKEMKAMKARSDGVEGESHCLVCFVDVGSKANLNLKSPFVGFASLM
jgi:hypothetical protein